MEEKEQLEVSKEYKEAYNKADMIVTYMPHILKGVKMPEKDKSEFDKGFSARLKEYEKEQELLRGYQVERMKQDYKKDMDNPSKDQDRGIDIPS
ncbi:MAG: hypothetical protein AAGA64_02180 [Bacteroidota bacterium]